MALNFDNKQDLKDNELFIVLRSCNKIDKLGKCIVKYSLQKPIMTEFGKGYEIDKEQWFDNYDMFNKLKQEDFGKIVKAKFGYKLLNNGHVDLVIKDICI